MVKLGSGHPWGKAFGDPSGHPEEGVRGCGVDLGRWKSTHSRVPPAKGSTTAMSAYTQRPHLRDRRHQERRIPPTTTSARPSPAQTQKRYVRGWRARRAVAGKFSRAGGGEGGGSVAERPDAAARIRAARGRRPLG